MIFDLPEWDAHEGLHILTDADSGLRAVVAVHSTHLGPGGGGTRLWSYPDERAAIRDALRLSRAMSYKNAMAGLELGGGKGVILRPDGDIDREALFAAYGQALEACGGTYKTAEDVGVGPADMDVIARHTSHVAGVTEGPNASGDPSPHTARGVFLGLKAALGFATGSDDLRGVRVAVQGLGSVGYGLAEHLAGAGAELLVADIDADAVARAERELGAQAVGVESIHAVEADVFAPCALSHSIRPETVDELRVAVVCGGANNQLASPEMGEALVARGIAYAPDYVVNAGGIINVASELSGNYSESWVRAKVDDIPATLLGVLERAKAEGRPPGDVADAMARERIGRG